MPRMPKNLIRLVPDNAEYYYLLGIVQRELGKQKKPCQFEICGHAGTAGHLQHGINL